MSYVNGFGMPSESSNANNNYVNCDDDSVEENYAAQKVVYADSEDDACDEMPWESCEAYKKCFREVLNGAFGVVVDRKKTLSHYGMDFPAFKKDSAALLQKGIDEQAIAVHLICTQYAKATGLENGDEWEKIDNMKSYYASGQLPRLVTRSKRPRFDFTKTVAAEPLLTSEQFLQLKGVADTSTVEVMNELLQEHDLASSLPAARFADLLFPCLCRSIAKRESDLRDQLEPFYIRILSGRSGPKTTFVTEVDNGYGGSNGYGYGGSNGYGYGGSNGYGYGGEGSVGSISEGDPEDRITWTDLVRDMKLNVANEIQGLDEKTRQKLVANILRVKNSATDDDINQFFLMKCGAAFSMKHSRLVEKDKETNKNMYRRKLVPVMKEIIAQVKSDVFFLK